MDCNQVLDDIKGAEDCLRIAREAMLSGDSLRSQNALLVAASFCHAAEQEQICPTRTDGPAVEGRVNE